MNKYQIAKHDSYKLVVKVARSDKATTDSIPSFARGIDTLEVIVEDLDRMKIEQKKNISGITDDKSDVQEELCDYLLEISGAIHSYAYDKKDYALMALVDFKPNSVEKMLQSDLITACEAVKQEAAKIPVADLAEEGITAQDLETFTKLIDEYKKLKPTPREAIIERSTHTVNIKDLFTEANLLIKKRLDRLAAQFKRKNPDYYLKYKAARNIIYSKPNNIAGSNKTNLV